MLTFKTNGAIREEGARAYLDGCGSNDCPYFDSTENILEVGYWKTSAAKRQFWMAGF